MSDAWRRAPNEVDPLSWFSGPLVPLVFGGLAITFGVAVTLISHGGGPDGWFDWAAVACLLLGFLAVGLVANPTLTVSRLVRTIPPILLGWASFILSLFAHLDGPRLMVEVWWAPVGLAFLIGALAPYSSAVRLLIVGSATAVFTGVAIAVVPFNRVGYWPPFSESLIGSGFVIVATAAATVFAYHVVMRIRQWSSTDPGAALSSAVLGESARMDILQRELASVGDRTLPFLRKVAHSGIVTADDRDHAKLLAEEVRGELVERANRSWLDSLAMRMDLTVLDAEHHADRMTPNQRAALLGLLGAVSDNIGDTRSTIVIQLRPEPDGSTAVALSTDVQLPEGRRTTLLAPHYFSLQAEVDGLHWSRGGGLGLQFRLPPNSRKDS
ncbi:MAG TPA: hypothetical protein PJ998_07525 [Terrimesophilobacter sp.]|nr:hypothetical protein [Terrimesophilobacter sp.]